jgi:cyclopropane-fatty-acyl-phospholipid synthase
VSLTLPPPSGYRPQSEPARWPDIAALPPPGPRARIAQWLFERVAARLDVVVLLPGGRNIGGGHAGAPVMRLVRPGAFHRRVGAGGLVGFGEAYMAGDWTADDLTGVLTVFCERMAHLVPVPLQRLRDLAVHAHPQHEKGTEENARRNIARHYDLSNELFGTFLDETMTYSSALFACGNEPDWLSDRLHSEIHASWPGLVDAQHRKIDRLLDATGVRAGSRVLEIGTGWGELAMRAAARGAHVRSITLSEEQRALALHRVAAAGLAGRVDIDLCDYRGARGQYDAVVSVEMIEAVGYDFWGVYFAGLAALLAPGGRVGLQAITMPHDRMLASRDTYTWIHKYVFPGGLLPSVQAVEHAAADAGLAVTDRLAFGAHYAETLRLWRERFTASAEQVEALGFDETFRRMWTFYLAYSESGFRSRYIDVHQFVLARPAGV